MGADLLRILHPLSAGDAERVVLGLNFQILPVDSRQLDYRNQIISLLKHWSWSSPGFDGHTLTFRGECPDAENEEPVPCGL